MKTCPDCGGPARPHKGPKGRPPLRCEPCRRRKIIARVRDWQAREKAADPEGYRRCETIKRLARRGRRRQAEGAGV